MFVSFEFEVLQFEDKTVKREKCSTYDVIDLSFAKIEFASPSFLKLLFVRERISE